jgi:hypothetical protein
MMNINEFKAHLNNSDNAPMIVVMDPVDSLSHSQSIGNGLSVPAKE